MSSNLIARSRILQKNAVLGPRFLLCAAANIPLNTKQDRHPALFQLIFTTEYKNHADPDLQSASRAAYGSLSEVCALFEPLPDGPGVNELRIWSLVHGYATLRTFTRSAAPDTGAPIPFDMLLPQMTPRATR